MSTDFEMDVGGGHPSIDRYCRHLSENSPHPIVVVEGADHVVRYVNPAFARLVGEERENLVGRPFAEAVPEGAENGCLALLDRVRLSGQPEILAEQEHNTRDRPRPVFWSYSVWELVGEDDLPAVALIQVTDATEIALFRRQASAVNEALVISSIQQHELAESEKSLAEELKAGVEARDRFLAVLSHELRNPLAAIQNAVTLAARSGATADLEWSRDVTARQLKNFSHLIDDLLDVSRISQGKIRLRKELIDAGPVIEHAAETVKPLIEARRHDLRISLASTRLWVEADATRLEQMLVNLLANAAKYTPPGGRIDLVAGIEGGEFVCRVRDDGVGIAPELLPRMFDMFTQADRSLARSEGGLGIGLSLVRSLAGLHGGGVSAASDGLDKGSEFTLRLPAPSAQPARPSGSAAKPERPAIRGAEILVVDDNKDAALGMARLLQLTGHRVRVAHDGPDALASARERPPEVVILDIGLPGMDGYEVASRLRQDAATRESLIVAVTGYGEEQNRARALASGFDHHLVKPVEFARLLAVMAGVAPTA
ncbi:hybrid sensor histidine kinase/response regulator [Paludisphaera soli]|uniref:hybrid sensor histidine kinase/response regulator n=1 Tax=Paludisphaera soli TaxID=2712865 RepID=UPI0013E9CB3D|nr:ATP-binding protein [Paludisphaera soli]